MRSENKDVPEKRHGAKRTKKPYSKPQLTVHGTVEKLTAKVSGHTDGAGRKSRA